MSKINGNKEVKRKAKKPKIIRINLSLVIGIIAIIFSFFSFILTYKLAIIGTQKFESFSAETLVNDNLSTAATTYSVYNDIYLYVYAPAGTLLGEYEYNWNDTDLSFTEPVYGYIDTNTFLSEYSIEEWDDITIQVYGSFRRKRKRCLRTDK